MQASALLMVAIAISPLRDGAAQTERQPPAEAPRLDLYGDPLPPGAIARMGTVRFRHGSIINAIAFSPDGSTLAAGDWRGAVILWDVDSGLPRQRWLRKLTHPDRIGGVVDVAFSADGSLLAFSHSTAADGPATVTILNVETGEEVARIDNISTAGDEAKWQPNDHQIAFTPDAKHLVSAGENGHVRLWDVETGARLLERRWDAIMLSPQRADSFTDMAISSDGRTFAGLAGGGTTNNAVRLLIWPLGSSEEPLVVEALANCTYPSVAFSPDGSKVYTGGDLESWAVTNETTGERVSQRRSGVRVWDAKTGEKLGEIADPERNGAFRSMTLAPDGASIFIRYFDGEIEDRDAESGELKATVRAPSASRPAGYYERLVISKDGRLLAYPDNRNALRIWDLVQGAPLNERGERPNPDAASIAYVDGGAKLLASSSYVPPRFWDPATGRLLGEIELDGERRAVGGLRLSADEKRMLTPISNLKLETWSLVDRRRIREFDFGGERFRSYVISPDGALVATAFTLDLEMYVRARSRQQGAADETQTILQIWEVDSGDQLHEFKGSARDMTINNFAYVAFTPDGERIVYSDSTTVRVWDVATGALRIRFDVGEGFDRPFDLSADGKLLAALGPSRRPFQIGRLGGRTSAGDNAIALWSLESAELARRIDVDEAAGEEIRLLPNNRGALTLTEMRDVVRLYDLQTGEIAREYRIEPDRGFSDITVAPDGRSFAVAVSDGTVLTYPIPEIP
jgi:WD40 repeat protein